MAEIEDTVAPDEEAPEADAREPAGTQPDSNADLRAAVDEMRGMWQGLVGHITERDRTDLKRQAGAIEARMREAVGAADQDAYDRARKDLDTLQDQMQKLANAPAAAPANPDYDAFVARAKTPDGKAWYGVDIGMTAFADSAGQVAYRNGLRGAALYSAVEKAVKDHYPSRFSNINRLRPSAVEGGQGVARTPKGKGFADLPPEGKQAFAKFVAKGTFKDTEEDRAEYARAAFQAMPAEAA